MRVESLPAVSLDRSHGEEAKRKSWLIFAKPRRLCGVLNEFGVPLPADSRRGTRRKRDGNADACNNSRESGCLEPPLSSPD